MKIFVFSLLFCTLANFASASTIKKELTSFTGVEFTGNYSVKMIPSDSNYIVVNNQDEDKVSDQDIVLEVENQTFKMYIKQDMYAARDITVELYYVSVESILARRGAEIECGTISGEKVAVSVTTGGKIKVRAQAKHILVSIKSGGSIRVKGEADSASYEVNAGGVIAAAFFNAKSVDATVQFGGEIILNATEKLWAAVKAGGSISYKGSPLVKKQSIKLGGTIENLDEK